MGGLGSLISSGISAIGSGLSNMVGGLGSGIGATFNGLGDLLTPAAETLTDTGGQIASDAAAGLMGGMNFADTGMGAGMDFITGGTGALNNSITSGATTALGAIGDTVSNTGGMGLGSLFKEAGVPAFNAWNTYSANKDNARITDQKLKESEYNMAMNKKHEGYADEDRAGRASAANAYNNA